jgi:hypothetical protein
MSMMMVDQLGERLRVGLIPDVEGGKPVEFAGGCPGTGFRHLGDAEINAIGEYGCEQEYLVFPRFTTALRLGRQE